MKEIKLSTWLFWRPIQFALILMFLFMLTSLLFNAIGATSATLMWIMMGAAFIIATIWEIKKLPSQNMTRRNFIALDVALGIITYIGGGAMLLALLTLMQSAFWYTGGTSMLTTSIILILALMYMIGVANANIYALYCRTRKMGISRTMAILAIPAGYVLLRPAAYLLSDKRPEKTPHTQNRYWTLIDKIILNNQATLWTLMIMIILATILSGLLSFASVLMWCGLATFIIWRRTVGADALRKNIHRTYAAISAALNVIIILGVIIGGIVISNNTPTTIINITDTPTTQITEE